MTKKLASIMICLILVATVFAVPVMADTTKAVLLAGGGPSGDKETQAWRDAAVKIFPDIVNIEYQYADDPLQKARLAKATGGHPYDVVGIDRRNMPGLVEEGVIRPIDDLLNKYGKDLRKMFSSTAWKAASYKGHIYFIPIENPWIQGGWRFRNDVLRDLKLAVPKTIVDLEKVMAAVKKKFPNQYPLGIPASMTYTYLANPITDVKSRMVRRSDGSVIPWQLSSYGKALASQINKWVKVGYVTPDYATINQDEIYNIFRRGQSTIIAVDGHGGYFAPELDKVLTDAVKKQGDFLAASGTIQGAKGKLRAGRFPYDYGPGFTAYGTEKRQQLAMSYFNAEAANADLFMTCLFGPQGMWATWKVKNNQITEVKNRDFKEGEAFPSWNWGMHYWMNGRAWNAAQVSEESIQGYYQNKFHDTLFDKKTIFVDPLDQYNIVGDVPDIWEQYPAAKDFWTNIMPWAAVAGTTGDFEQAWNAYLTKAQAAGVGKVATEYNSYYTKQYGSVWKTTKGKMSLEK